MSPVNFSLPVRLAGDCPECPGCGEPWCALHGEHYADCPCPGPHSEPDDEEAPHPEGTPKAALKPVRIRALERLEKLGGKP